MTNLKRCLLLLGPSVAFFLTSVSLAQQAPSDLPDSTAVLVQSACDVSAPSGFRAFKQRQIQRRLLDLEKTVSAMRADALSNADTYTPEDRKDFTVTLERLRTQQDDIHAFLVNGCATMPFATPAIAKQLPATFPVSPARASAASEAVPSNVPVRNAIPLSAPISRQPSSNIPSNGGAPSREMTPALTTGRTPAPQQPATPSTVIPPNAPQLTTAPNVDVQALKKQVDDIQDALSKQPRDFGLVLGVGSLVVNPNVSDYTNDSNVLHSTNLGSATPQLLSGVTFRSHLPSLTRRFRVAKERCGNPPKEGCLEPWQYHPWSGFVSLKFAPGASQFLNGYVIGGTYSITKHLDVMVGFALTPINEASPGFRVTAAQFVVNQQKLGLDLNFDPNAMLANKRDAFDGFPTTDPSGKLIYQGSPTTVHYRGGAVFGVSFPLYFGSSLKPAAKTD